MFYTPNFVRSTFHIVLWTNESCLGAYARRKPHLAGLRTRTNTIATITLRAARLSPRVETEWLNIETDSRYVMKSSAFEGIPVHFSQFVRLTVASSVMLLASCRTADSKPLDDKSTGTPEMASARSTTQSAQKLDSGTIVDAAADAPEAGFAAKNAEGAAKPQALNEGFMSPAPMDDAGLDAATDPDALLEPPPPPPPCPPEMTLIGRYCVDRWEGHLVTKNPDGSTLIWPHYTRPENAEFLAAAAKGVFPQAYISRVEAKRACNNAGKRLCSRSEWMRACKGSRGFRYPYGNTGKRGACNTGKAHLLYTFFGAKRGGWSYENFNDPKLNQEPGFLAKSGDYETCHSDEDVYDIVGNLHEWINDDVGTDIEQVLEKDGVERKEQPWRAGNGMFMGGFFSTTVEHGPGCTYTTIAHEPTYHDYSTGFRCCKSAVLPEKPKKPKGKSKK